jgi:hypothetical protein
MIEKLKKKKYVYVQVVLAKCKKDFIPLCRGGIYRVPLHARRHLAIVGPFAFPRVCGVLREDQPLCHNFTGQLALSLYELLDRGEKRWF